MIDLNRLTIGAVTGALVNALIAGGLARIAMRAVVILLQGVPSFTWGGTIGIMILAAIFGIPIGVTLTLLRMWRPKWRRRIDLGMGVVLALLFGGFFFVVRDGELALLPAWKSALLFGSIPLVGTLAIGTAIDGLDRRITAWPPQRVARPWLAAMAACLLLAFAGMLSLGGEGMRMPRALWTVMDFLGMNTGLDFSTARGLIQGTGLLFVLGYCTLCWTVFWLGSRHATLRCAAAALALLASGLFHVESPLVSLAGRAGAPILDGLSALAGASLLGVVYYRMRHDSELRPGARWAWAGLLATGIGVGCLQVAMVLSADFRLVNASLPATLFGVPPYLLPWLALPAGFVGTALSIRRHAQALMPAAAMHGA